MSALTSRRRALIQAHYELSSRALEPCGPPRPPSTRPRHEICRFWDPLRTLHLSVLKTRGPTLLGNASHNAAVENSGGYWAHDRRETTRGRPATLRSGDSFSRALRLLGSPLILPRRDRERPDHGDGFSSRRSRRSLTRRDPRHVESGASLSSPRANCAFMGEILKVILTNRGERATVESRRISRKCRQNTLLLFGPKSDKIGVQGAASIYREPVKKSCSSSFLVLLR